MNILLAVILGGLFGFALYFTGASHPKKLVSMLKLHDISLMKIILFAIGLSSVLLSIANALGILDLSHLSIKSTNLGVLIGGLIFGVGFGWIGSCPGTCVAASGSDGIKKALICAGRPGGRLCLQRDLWLLEINRAFWRHGSWQNDIIWSLREISFAFRDWFQRAADYRITLYGPCSRIAEPA